MENGAFSFTSMRMHFLQSTLIISPYLCLPAFVLGKKSQGRKTGG